MQKPDLSTLVAFAFVVLIGGSNAVAVRFSNLSLPPFWGAALRFAAAAAIFWLIALALRLKIPRGRHFLLVVGYGMLSFGLSYACLYWALLRIQAGLSMTVLAFTPLLTFFFAVLLGLERFRWRGLAGALIALAGIMLSVRGALGANIPLPSLLAIAAAAVFISLGNVFYKKLPSSSPVVMNAIALTGGSALLLVISWIAREAWLLPNTTSAAIAVVYLILAGSVLLFYLYLYVLGRWTASATSYSFLLFPIAAVILGAAIAGEQVSLFFVAGGVLVMLGVWLGALSGAKSTPAPEPVSTMNTAGTS